MLFVPSIEYVTGRVAPEDISTWRIPPELPQVVPVVAIVMSNLFSLIKVTSVVY